MATSQMVTTLGPYAAAPRHRGGSGSRPVLTLWAVVVTNAVMVATHTTMQYGHRAPMRYRLAKMSQCTNTTPNVVPAWMPHQNQPGRRDPGEQDDAQGEQGGETDNTEDGVGESEGGGLSVCS